MSLMTMIFFIVFMIPITLGIIFLRKSKKFATIILSVPFIFIVLVGAWWFYETNHRFVGDTDLADEHIGDLTLYDDVTEELIESYGSYKKEDNINYDELFVFDQLDIGASVHDEIIYIRAKTPKLSTSKGVKIGDHIEDVTEKYGDKYYKRADMGMGESLNYVDRDAKIHLQFYVDGKDISYISMTAL